MRRKKRLAPRMEAVSRFLETQPDELQGRWREVYPAAALYAELGCGMGRFCTEMAARHPGTLYAAVERVPDALVVGMERCDAKGLQNLRFINDDVQRLAAWFAPGELDGIYINFCDPWPKKRQFKRRLTHPDYLARYAPLLKPGGSLVFKTDNRPLFDFSLAAISGQPGWTVRFHTTDLHGPDGGDVSPLDTVVTEYEEKWMKAGVPICALSAEKNA